MHLSTRISCAVPSSVQGIKSQKNRLTESLSELNFLNRYPSKPITSYMTNLRLPGNRLFWSCLSKIHLTERILFLLVCPDLQLQQPATYHDSSSSKQQQSDSPALLMLAEHHHYDSAVPLLQLPYATNPQDCVRYRRIPRPDKRLEYFSSIMCRNSHGKNAANPPTIMSSLRFLTTSSSSAFQYFFSKVIAGAWLKSTWNRGRSLD